MLAKIALAFLAGGLSALSPCVLPLLPVVAATAGRESRYGPLALAGGLAAAYTAAGMTLALVGWELAFDPRWLRWGAAALLILAGLVLASTRLQSGFSSLMAGVGSGASTLLARISGQSLAGQFAVGALLGLVWSPCVGPTLGGAVALAAERKDLFGAVQTLAAFSAGAVAPLLAIAYGAGFLPRMNRRAAAAAGIQGKKVLGATLALVGILAMTGWDHQIETWLVAAMPSWLSALTTSI